MSTPTRRSLRATAAALLLSACGLAIAAPVGGHKDAPVAAVEPSPSTAAEPAIRIDPDLVKVGSEKYHMYCQRCHGLNMVNQGGGTFDLRTFPLQDKARFLESVKNGKRSMPAWGGALTEQDLEALWNYIANHQVAKGGTP